MRALKILTLFLLLKFTVFSCLLADEGMWLLPYVKDYNMETLKAMGLELDAEDIYNPGQPSLFMSIVNVGNAGTGSVVSPEGLVLTNHHVVYDHLQRISTLENDYLTHGFWADSRESEIPLPGLTVSFLRNILNVTDYVLVRQAEEEALEDGLSMRQIYREVTRDFASDSRLQAYVMSFFQGTKFLLFEYEIFEDVRLVGAPPSSIGKFGGDQDNFIWPRHSGDFAFIRVYSGADNMPARYESTNRAYTSGHHLSMNPGGIQEGDFSMVLGYPGSTQRYITSREVEEMLRVSLPARIAAREIKLAIWWEAMLADEKVRLDYASSHFNSSNGLKLAQGQYEQLLKHDVAAQKRMEEKAFKNWLSDDPGREARYGEALGTLNHAMDGREKTLFAHQLLNEALLMGTEIYVMGIRANIFGRNFEGDDPGEFQEAAQSFRQRQSGFYEAYSPETDRRVVSAMLHLLRDSLDAGSLPALFDVISNEHNGVIDSYVDHLFSQSIFTHSQRFHAFMDDPNKDVLMNDPLIAFSVSIYDKAIELRDVNHEYNDIYRNGQGLFMEGLREMAGNEPLYPDANFTMRLNYGRVASYSPTDAVHYDYLSTLRGVIEKENPDHPDFVVPQKLKQLYQDKDFGSYAEGNRMPLAFITDNDIVGGNSGSPVLNARGEIIGLVFCGSWESLAGSVAFLEKKSRAINVDIRYVLFIVDKFADSEHILQELELSGR